MCALHKILGRAKGSWNAMERSDLVCWAKPYKKHYLAKNGDGWSCELDFERRLKTNSNGCGLFD